MKYTFLFVLLAFFCCSKKNEKILPFEQNLTESVYTSVTIQPDSLYQAYAIVAGILDQNLVEEGDLISKGTALMQIINSTPKLNTQNARLALELAQENYSGSAAVLDGIRDEITAATLKYKNDSINYFRQKNLWQQNIGSNVEYDTKKLNYQLSKNNLQLLKSKYKRTENELKTAVKQAKNNYESSIINTKDFTVKSAISGKVYALYKEPGELISNQEPLATLGSASKFIIKMLVDEVDIVKIVKGQQVLITLDAYPNELYTGHVSKILPKKDERNQTFTVEALFNKTPKTLYPGLSGEANIIIAKKTTVLTIPISYLINSNKVQTKDGLRTITVGLQNMEYVEILSGIDKNTYIYKPKD